MVKWQRIESPGTGGGIPDVCGGLRAHVSQRWIELKIVRGRRIYFRPKQPSWLRTWPAPTFIVARNKTDLLIWSGKDALSLAKGNVFTVPPLRAYKGRGNWDWEDFIKVIFY